MTKVKKSSILLTCLLLALLCGLLFYIDGNASKYIIRITRLCAINIVLALSMNLVNGFTGIFSLGHAGFMAIGAYTVALLTIPVAKKETIFMLEPLIAPLNTLTLPFGAALVIGGLLAHWFPREEGRYAWTPAPGRGFQVELRDGIPLKLWAVPNV